MNSTVITEIQQLEPRLRLPKSLIMSQSGKKG